VEESHAENHKYQLADEPAKSACDVNAGIDCKQTMLQRKITTCNICKAQY